MRSVFALALALATEPAAADVVDRVVVVVDEEIVLASEVRLEAVLTGLDEPELPFWTLDNGTSDERMEQAALVRALATGVDLYDPTQEEIDRRVAILRSRFGADEAWEAFQQLWGLDDRGLGRIVRRRLLVERYLARNLAEDPSNTSEWLTACRALLDEVRPRFRIRHIAQRGGS